MIEVVIGNIIALLASFFMVLAGCINNKKGVLSVQTIQLILLTVSTFILGGYAGTIINALSVGRNILCYKERFNLNWRIVFSALSIVIPLWVDNLSLIGVLPIISSLLYIWFINEKDMVKIKWLLIVTALLWFIYDILIQSYTSAIFNFLCAILALVTLIKLLYKKGLK